MSSKLQIIVDISGSMFEMAKMSISMNLLSTIREFNNINQAFDEVSLFFWNEKIKKINFIETEDFMIFTASGKLSFEILKKHLLLFSQNDEEIKVLLLSDGNYTNNEFDNFSNYIRELLNIFIVPIHIGADSSTDKLKIISCNSYTYLAEDILSALKYLEHISIHHKSFSPPNFIEDILNKSIEEENQDEW